jgi:hypothetical protein
MNEIKEKVLKFYRAVRNHLLNLNRLGNSSQIDSRENAV